MKKIMMALIAILIVTSAVGQVQAAVSFKDVNGHWAKEDIQAMSKQGYIGGYADGTFKPNGKITRAEFISILTRILEVPGANNSFSDVSAATWAKEAIGGAAQVGIIDKAEYSTSFKPNQPITRREIAKMIALGEGYQNAEFTDLLTTYKGLYSMDLPFADAKKVAKADIPYITLANGLGILGGDTNYNVNPSANATRAEATAMLYRLVQKKDKSINEFRALKEYEEVAQTGTNMTTVSKLIPKQDSFKNIVVENQNFKATLKRVYILPKDRSSIYEKKFALYRDQMASGYKAPEIQGITVGIMDIEYKKDGVKGYFLYGQNLFFGSGCTIDFELYKAEKNFNYVTYETDQSLVKKERKTKEVVDFDLFSLTERFGELQINHGGADVLLYVNPDGKF